MTKRRDAPSDSREALAARQAEHRLRKRVRPAEPVSESADPWLLGDEALDAVDRLKLDWSRPHHRKQGAVVEDFELVAERIRQLCWGPED